MTKLMDDPTTYLHRDYENIAIMLAGSIESARFHAKQYGVSIQLNMAGGYGIRVVSNVADAASVIGAYPPSTPWCIIADGLTDKRTREMLTSYFGLPKTIDKALDVKTVGIAWRPDKFPVYGM